MRRLLAVTVSILLVGTVAVAVGVEPEATPEAGDGRPSDLASEVKIRELYVDFMDAWNRHDARAMAQFWAFDGDHYEPDGRSAEGRAAVEKLFAQEQATAFKESKLKLTIDSVWMITPRVALVNGSYQVDGVHGPQGKKVDIRRGHLTSVLLNEEGKWSVAASRTMIPAQLPWR